MNYLKQFKAPAELTFSKNSLTLKSHMSVVGIKKKLPPILLNLNEYRRDTA